MAPRSCSASTNMLLLRKCLAVVVVGGFAASASFGQNADPLVAGFENPPSSAQPRVWWHWLDGNVSEQGIRKDLDWLHAVGIGGVHNFDASLSVGGPAPKITDRVAYLTDEWRRLFRLSVEHAQKLGMEFTIAASPGWSESGGPWVKPDQAMKKFVWSETVVNGGRKVTAPLPHPPGVTGPFQNIALTAVPFAVEVPHPDYYADAAVIAYRAPATEGRTNAPKPDVSSSSGAVDAALLADGDVARAVSLPFGDSKLAWIQYTYARPLRVQSVTVSVTRPAGGAPSDMATGASIWLEVSDDGKSFRRVLDIPRNGAPQQTLAFAPVSARSFRLVLERPTPRPSILEMLGLPPEPAATSHQVAEFSLLTAPRINRFEDKAGFTNRAIAATEDTPVIDTSETIAKADVIDLTAKLRTDGTLDWLPPSGRWVILRFGYSLTGRSNHPASREGTGLEVDKLNRKHVKSYIDAYLGEYLRALGPDLIGRQGLQNMLTDSYEAGIANWTDDILDQFAKRRGYDPRPWLPTLAGRVVVSAADSDRFLWDFRQTLGDLIADEHYGYLSELLEERGMGRYGESHEGGRAFLGDGMKVKKSADIPMGALWASAPWPHEHSNNADIRESASVAHIYGQKFVAAESLTAFGNTFAFTPETLKPHADRELAMGLNRFVIHTSVHQPDDRPGPGVTLGPFGQWFTRHETWAAQAKPWVSYLSRSSYLLQQGRFVADVAYLYGESDNITDLFGGGAPPIPVGYNFDYVNADALMNVFSVKDGKLSTPSGMQYRVLALDASTRRMSLPLLLKIRDLVNAGATVVGARPEMTPSLADDAKEFDGVVDGLWGRAGGGSSTGKVVVASIEEALRSSSIAPDLLFSGRRPDSKLYFVHRSLDDGDLYFISNGDAAALSTEASFRISGKAPEIWRADTGARQPASYRYESERTVVPLDLEPNDAFFVVFRKAGSPSGLKIPKTTPAVIATLKKPWDVSFEPGRGAPTSARFDVLSSWTQSADAGIKYFSGTATYSTTFDANRGWLNGQRVRMNLGELEDIAEVAINGRALGILWKKPFVVDVTDALRAGANRLEIKVTNVWPNRMIGDKQPGMQHIAYSTFDPFKMDSPLLSAGLLGPVTLEIFDKR